MIVPDEVHSISKLRRIRIFVVLTRRESRRGMFIVLVGGRSISGMVSVFHL